MYYDSIDKPDSQVGDASFSKFNESRQKTRSEGDCVWN